MRIPLYNQTGTPSVQTKAQQLSPRASAGAFTQQGQAVAQLGQQIAQTGEAVADSMIKFRQQQEKIEFDFAMAEKQAETERALDEARVLHNEQSMKFIEENKDTDTTTFRNNYDTFNKDFLASNIDTRTDLTDNQKQAVRSGLNAQIIAKGNSGAKNAFDRAQVIRGQAARDSLASMIQDASSFPEGHPERQRLETEIEQRIIKAERDGLRTGYTVQGVKVGFETLDLDAQVRGATSFSQLELIEQKVGKSALGAQGRSRIHSAIKTRKSELRNDIYQSNLSAIEAIEVQFDDQEDLRTAIINGTPYQGVDANGDEVVVDTSGLKDSTRISIAQSMLPQKFKDLDDFRTQAMVDGLVSGAEIGGDVLSTLDSAAALYDKGTLEVTGKTPDDIDAAIVMSANQLASQAAREVASGDFDESRVLSQLNNAQALIEQTIGGRTPLARNIETSSDANRISNTIVSVRADLAKAQKEAALLNRGVDLFNNGRLSIQDIGLSTDEEQAVIAKGLSEIDTLEGQINRLSDNDVEFKQWTRLLSAAKNRIMDPTVTTLSDDVQNALQIFQAISLQGRDGVYENHVKEQDRVFWNSWKTLTSIHSPEVAMQMIKQQRSDLDVDVSYQLVADQIETQGSELYEMGWFKTALSAAGLAEKTQMPENTGQITSFVRDVSREYMKFGLDPEDALTMAANDYFKTHVPVGNVMLRKPAGQKFSDNLPEIRELLVAKFLEDNPDNPFEADDLSIMNIGDSVDIFSIVHGGGFPASGYNSNRFTLSEMEEILSQAEAMANQRRLKEAQDAIRDNME